MANLFEAKLPNLKHVRAVVLLAELGRLVEVAAVLNLSQPAISQGLGRVSEAFGGPLFKITPAGAKPTPRGDVVIPRLRRGLDVLARADTALVRSAGRGGDIPVDPVKRYATTTNLRAVAARVQAGSFAGAARLLGISEPSVNRAARGLEVAMRLKLFEYSKAEGRPTLTRIGRRLARYATLALKEFATALEEANEFDGSFDGSVMIGTLPLVRTRIVPTAAVELTRRYPYANLSVSEGDFKTLIGGVACGELDMLIGALRESLPERGLAQRVLFDDSLSIVARSDHELAGKAVVTAEDLARFSWVLPRESSPSRQLFDRAVQRQHIVLKNSGVIETGSLAVMRGVLLGSDRLTVISRTQISFEEEVGWLKPLNFELDCVSRPIGLITRSDWQPTLLQSYFLKRLVRAARAEQRSE